jgi:hypothetical protein
MTEKPPLRPLLPAIARTPAATDGSNDAKQKRRSYSLHLLPNKKNEGISSITYLA